MGSRNHEARDSESPKAPDAGGPSRESATRGRSAQPDPDARSEAGSSDAASQATSETRPSQPAPAALAQPRPALRQGLEAAGEEPDEVEPHVAISFGFEGEGIPPSSGPISRPNIAGRYRLDRRLAEGGMGIVYAGWHVTLDQPVAIKVIQKDLINNADAVKRFIEEARALAQLRGPHVAQVLDAGIEDGTPFIVMELLKGRDLRTLLGEQQMPVTQAVQLVREACEAVSEAHAKGILHRDLKPENLFLAQAENGSSILKVIDFGISARQGADGGYDSHEPGPGSPEYMAPEQLLPGKTIDHRADIWSLGVVLYELLTGSVPFGGETAHAICSAVVAAEPPPLRKARPEVPAALEAVILRCLHKLPEERFTDAQELAHALFPFEPAPVALLPSMRVAAMRSPVRVLSPNELQAAEALALADKLAPTDSLAPAQLGRRSTGSWRVGVGVIAGCLLGIVGYFATRVELGPSGAAGDGSGVSISGGETAPAEGLNQGPTVAPVTDAPNVLPILRDDAETPNRRRPQVRGPLVFPPAPVRGTTADQSLEAELDHVGQAVSGLVDEADEQPPSEEELVEARYALAASKPKPSAEPEPAVPPPTLTPAPAPAPLPLPRPPLSLGSENSAGTPPALPKGPSRGAFPDASSP